MWINTGARALLVWLELCVTVILQYKNKWQITHQVSCNRAVREGDPRVQDCVWKIRRSVRPSITAGLLL